MVCVAGNLMPAAWHTPISASPPLYGILISPKRHTYDLLVKNEGFVVNFLQAAQAELISKVGSTSGRNIDKFTAFEIGHAQGKMVNGAVLEKSYAAYECRKAAVNQYGDHFLFVGEIVLIHFHDDILRDGEFVDEKTVRPVLYFGKDRYLTIDPQSLKVWKREA